ncbi:MAG TPA: TetR/AcrR family transcriptional regulator [Pedobacter sp.]|uniref:TetR/AcrR family transcriptional regulator n=1 Tax=Pedobacter sp. TaxID=1411316 RepID=UPI002C93A532|nr:TetR/AcrR family transcriptional regulator [Pedobacter sp.]HMI01455.1 TetR/AcrR family transcriptional regulator [Pedobacter sp.]
MGISERKEREREEMKQLIMGAALKMFLEDGYAKTSIRNIADAIEYSPGTIYLYYKDKDELLFEVQRHAYGKLLEAFKTYATSKHPFERLAQVCKTYISFGLENPELYDLMFIIRAPMNADESQFKSNGEDSFKFLVDTLAECITQGLIVFNDIQLAALQVWAMAHGLVSLDLRCRLKVMMINDVTIRETLNQSMEEYLSCIRK